MSQDATWEEPAEEGRRMEKVFHHGASSSKKLKSFHSKDDQLVEHTTERGNASAKQQQSAEQNSQYDTDILQTTDIDSFVPAAIVEQSLLVIEACAGTATLSSVLTFMGFPREGGLVAENITFSWCATVRNGLESKRHSTLARLSWTTTTEKRGFSAWFSVA